jgi:hypothetical protein
MPLTQTENKFLNSLVIDSIIYRLSTAESLAYIKTRFKTISEAAYKQRKARVLSDNSTNIWLNQFTRIGFVTHHKQQIEHIQRLQEDSLRQFFIESIRDQGERNEDKLLRLKADIRDNSKLLSELGLGTPIIAAIKARLEGNKNNSKNVNAEAIQVSQ